jgi:hypothetical protein
MTAVEHWVGTQIIVLVEGMVKKNEVLGCDGSQMLKMNNLRAAAGRSRQFEKDDNESLENKTVLQASEKSWGPPGYHLLVIEALKNR